MALPSYEVDYADPCRLQAGNGNIIAPDHDPGARWSWNLTPGLSVQPWLPWAPSPAHRNKSTPQMSAVPWGCFILSPRPKAPVNEIGDRVTDVGHLEALGLLHVYSEGHTPQSQHGARRPGWAHRGVRLCWLTHVPLPREDLKVSKD